MGYNPSNEILYMYIITYNIIIIKKYVSQFMLLPHVICHVTYMYNYLDTVDIAD